MSVSVSACVCVHRSTTTDLDNDDGLALLEAHLIRARSGVVARALVAEVPHSCSAHKTDVSECAWSCGHVVMWSCARVLPALTE